MEQSTNLDKILNLLSNNLSYSLLELATEQLFSIAGNDPALNFVRIMDFYKKLITTQAESTRTTLPKIIIPQIIKFYNHHRECINDVILGHKKRRIDHQTNLTNIAKLREQQEMNEDICVDETHKPKRKRDSKRKKKMTNEIEESKTQEQPLLPEIDDEEMQLYDHLSHSLKDDSGLLQIEDIDINYIVFFCKPLVLSTSQQLEEENEKELINLKNKTKGRKKKKQNNFDTFASIDNMK